MGGSISQAVYHGYLMVTIVSFKLGWKVWVNILVNLGSCIRKIMRPASEQSKSELHPPSTLCISYFQRIFYHLFCFFFLIYIKNNNK